MDAKYKGLNYRKQQTEEAISVVKVREATTDLLSSNFDSLPEWVAVKRSPGGCFEPHITPASACNGLWKITASSLLLSRTPVSPLLSVHYTLQSKRQYLVTGSPEKLRSTVTGLLWVTCSPLNQSPALQAICVT